MLDFFGSISISPSVPQEFNGNPNPMYKSMVINIGSKYTTTLRYDGKQSEYYTKDCKEWEISHHIDIGTQIIDRTH